MTRKYSRSTQIGPPLRSQWLRRNGVICAIVLPCCGIVTALCGCAGTSQWNYRITGEARLYQIDQAVETFPVAGCGALHPAHAIAVGASDLALIEAGPGCSTLSENAGLIGPNTGADSSVPHPWKGWGTPVGPLPRFYYTARESAPNERSISVLLNRCFVKHLEDARVGEGRHRRPEADCCRAA
jgi:hypothetical protein